MKLQRIIKVSDNIFYKVSAANNDRSMRGRGVHDITHRHTPYIVLQDLVVVKDIVSAIRSSSLTEEFSPETITTESPSSPRGVSLPTNAQNMDPVNEIVDFVISSPASRQVHPEIFLCFNHFKLTIDERRMQSMWGRKESTRDKTNSCFPSLEGSRIQTFELHKQQEVKASWEFSMF